MSRFPQPLHRPTFENLFRYYGSMVAASVDQESGLAVVVVRAFTPEDAYEINSRLLGLSEELVNRLNERGRGDLLRYAQAEVAAAAAKAKEAK